MALVIPLLIMLVLLSSAWGVGALARSRGREFAKAVGAAGVLAVLLLPVAYDAYLFDGTCPSVTGETSPCTLGERIWKSIEIGFAYTIAPAVLWLATFVFSSRMGK